MNILHFRFVNRVYHVAEIDADQFFIIVLAGWRRGKSESVACRKFRNNISEHSGRHMIALVDKYSSESCRDITHVFHPCECLYHRNGYRLLRVFFG